MPLDKAIVPVELHSLIPLAEAWGSGDDLQRYSKIDNASIDSIVLLINSIKSCKYLFDWLAGKESYAEPPSEEYIAMSNLVDAYDHAIYIYNQYIGSN